MYMAAKLTKGRLWWLCNMSTCWKTTFPRILFPAYVCSEWTTREILMDGDLDDEREAAAIL